MADDTPMDRVSHGLQEIASELGIRIETIAGERLAFSLFVWSQPRCSYISTAARAEVIQVLEGMIARWKQGMPDAPAHRVHGVVEQLLTNIEQPAAATAAEPPCLHCTLGDAIECWIKAGHGTTEQALDYTVGALTEFVAAFQGREQRRRAIKLCIDSLPSAVRTKVANRIKHGLPTGDVEGRA